MTRTKAVVLALVIVAILVLLPLVFMAFYVIGASEPRVRDHSILVVDLSAPLTEHGARDGGLGALFGAMSHPLPAHEAASAVRRAGDDDRIAAIVLRGGFEGSFAALDMLRDALADARKSGKKIYAQLGSANERMLWLASAADEIWLEPLGMVELDGWSGDILYFGDALREFGIEVQVTRVGKYKSAVEPFMLGHMSDENREQLTEMIRSIEGQILGDLADARGLEVAQLREWTRERGWFSAQEAVEARLATHAEPYAALLEKLRADADVDEGEELPELSLAKYARSVRKKAKSGDAVRVIIADGEIVDGSSNSGIGGDDLAAELRAAREEERTVAVVLRVDSPGGSATASDVIRSEVLALKAAGKPVIVSMGSLAASGGYWISANADHIVAHPATLTGSIGVFGMLPNVEALAERNGLRAERIATSPLSGVGSPWKRMDERQMALVQGFVDDIYERFLDLVSEGRRMDRVELQEIAQGRVWTGARALELGLVDELGDLQRAIAVARERADLPADSPVLYPERKVEWFEELLQEIIEEQAIGVAEIARPANAARTWFGASALLEPFSGPPRVFARLPFDVLVR